MSDAKYQTTACRFCAYRLTHPGFEVVDLSKLNGQPPRRLQEFHGKLNGHIQMCASDEAAQIDALMKRYEKRKPGSAPPDISNAKHQAIWLACLKRVMLAQSTGILAAYTTTDPALLALQDAGRWNLHQETRKFHITDEMLSDRLQSLNLSPAVHDAVFSVVAEIRDILEEQGDYIPGAEGAATAEAAARIAAANAGQ